MQLIQESTMQRDMSERDRKVAIEPQAILEKKIAAIGGYWHTQVREYIREDEMDYIELKNTIASETLVYGVISALFLAIAQAALIIEVHEDAEELLVHAYVNIWFLCFMTNMFCILISTIEYINTISSAPEKILDLLAKRYPVGFGTMPRNCNFRQWARYLAVDKFNAFRYGCWLTVPGIVCGIFIVYGNEYAKVPTALACLTIVFAQLAWCHEQGACPLLLKKQILDTNSNVIL